MQPTVRFGYFGNFWNTKNTQQTPSPPLSPQRASRPSSPISPSTSEQPPADIFLPSFGSAVAIWNYLFSTPGSPSTESATPSRTTPPLNTLPMEQREKQWLQKVRTWKPQSTNPHAHYRRANPHEFAELKQFLESGVDVNATDRYSKNALMMAARTGYLPLVEFLFAQGANLHATDKDGYNALHEAASAAYKVEDGEENPHNQVAEFLLDKQVAPDLPAGLMRNTPLFLAAKNGNIPLLKMLKAKGADLGAANRNGDAPIHGAVSGNQQSAVKVLIDLGADVDTPNTRNGDRPAHKAARMSNLEMLKLLYLNEGSMRLPNSDGQLPRDLIRDPQLARLGFLY